MKTNLKPFDLAAAKAGAKVVTRDGRSVRIISYDMRSCFPIVALIECGDHEEIETCKNNGRAFPAREDGGDLFITPVKRRGWINIYRNPDAVRDSWGRVVYVTREEAVENIARDKKYVATAFAEWEE